MAALLHVPAASKVWLTRRWAIATPGTDAQEREEHHGMASRSNRNQNEDRLAELDQETQRYREAATLALEQLEWCVDYFHQLREPKVARQLAQNRKRIAEQAGILR
jgi:hypothetical protein